MADDTEIAKSLTNLRDALDRPLWKRFAKALVTVPLWFGIPFLTLWALGLPAEHAARAAVCPAMGMAMASSFALAALLLSARALVGVATFASKPPEDR